MLTPYLYSPCTTVLPCFAKPAVKRRLLDLVKVSPSKKHKAIKKHLPDQEKTHAQTKLALGWNQKEKTFKYLPDIMTNACEPCLNDWTFGRYLKSRWNSSEVAQKNPTELENWCNRTISKQPVSPLTHGISRCISLDLLWEICTAGSSACTRPINLNS